MNWLMKSRRTTRGPPAGDQEYVAYVSGADETPGRRRVFVQELQRMGLSELEWFDIQRRVADNTIADERQEYRDIETAVFKWFANERRGELGRAYDGVHPPDVTTLVPDNFQEIMQRRKIVEADWWTAARRLGREQVRLDAAPAQQDAAPVQPDAAPDSTLGFFETQLETWLLKARRRNATPNEQDEFNRYMRSFRQFPDGRIALLRELHTIGTSDRQWFRTQRDKANRTIDRQRQEYNDVEATALSWYENDRRRQLGMSHQGGEADEVDGVLPNNFVEIMQRESVTPAAWLAELRQRALDIVQRQHEQQQRRDPERPEVPEEKDQTAGDDAADETQPPAPAEENEPPAEEKEPPAARTSVGGNPVFKQVEIGGDPAFENEPDEPAAEYYNIDNWRGVEGDESRGYPASRTSDATHFFYWHWLTPSQTQTRDGKGKWHFRERKRKPRRRT